MLKNVPHSTQEWAWEKEIVVFIGLEKKNVRYVFPQKFVAETVGRTGQLNSDLANWNNKVLRWADKISAMGVEKFDLCFQPKEGW